MEKVGRIRSPPMFFFRLPRVMTELAELSEPVAAMVRMVPTGRVLSAILPRR